MKNYVVLYRIEGILTPLTPRLASSVTPRIPTMQRSSASMRTPTATSCGYGKGQRVWVCNLRSMSIGMFQTT